MNNLDIQNLCSRKLWELLTEPALPFQQSLQIELALLQRGHYLRELAERHGQTRAVGAMRADRAVLQTEQVQQHAYRQ